MLTDDPGTPGNGHLELNLAVTLERRAGEQSWETPVIDANYGVGERIQLNFETSFIVLKRSGHGLIGGPGSTSAAVKWRFLDQESDGISMSTYPRVEWNFVQSSVRRGLVEDGTRVFLPLEIARRVGIVDLDVEIGSLLRSIGRSEWAYGIVGGVAVTSTTGVMAELHGTARTNFARDMLTINVGVRQKFNAWSALIASLGHDIYSAGDDSLSLIGYCGVQFEF